MASDEGMASWADRMAAAIGEGIDEIEAGREPRPLWKRKETRTQHKDGNNQ